ncbi:hypothetical protein BH11GEM2_BH11GEM2_38250 [soil metagenome]
MEWIAVAVDIAADPAVHRMADALRVRVPEIVGLLALTFGRMAQHAPNGQLGSVPDSVIETWALWHGKKGRFAQQFRAELCDGSGLVIEWEEYNGAAIRRAESARDRTKTWRLQREKERAEKDERERTEREENAHGSNTRTHTSTHTGTASVCRTGQDRTGQDQEIKDLPLPPRAGEETRLAERAPEVWPVLARFIAWKDDTARAAWVGRCHGALDKPPHPTGAELADALEDLMTEPREKWVPALFRTYVGRIRRDAKREAERNAAPLAVRSLGGDAIAQAATLWARYKGAGLLTRTGPEVLRTRGEALVEQGHYSDFETFRAEIAITKPWELADIRIDGIAINELAKRLAPPVKVAS